MVNFSLYIYLSIIGRACDSAGVFLPMPPYGFGIARAELINNNEMGRHPYDRLRIIYAKQEDWNKAIKICQYFVDSIKSGNTQFVHPSFKITMKKYEEWIRKYERKLARA